MATQGRISDRVRETSTTSGTGTLTLDGAVAGFRTMASVLTVNADYSYFFATDGTSWEVFLGTRASSTTLARTTILASSNAGAPVGWTGATIDVNGGIPAALAEHLNMFAESLASATTTDLGTVQGLLVAISGVTTITSFGTAIFKLRIVRFDGALTLTHNGTSLILLTAANRAVTAGSFGIYSSDSAGNWREITFTQAGFGFASQSDVTTGTVTNKYLSPSTAKYHNGAAKVFGGFNQTGVQALSTSTLNVTSITDGGTGITTVNYTAALAASGAITTGCSNGAATDRAYVNNTGTSTCILHGFSGVNTATDEAYIGFEVNGVLT